MTDLTPEIPDRDDAELVKATVGGDRGAFDLLIRRYQRQATGVSYRLLSNLDDAMEVVQEAFLRAFRKLKTLDKPDRFGPWIMRIVATQSLNFRRSRSLRRMASLEDMDAGADESSRSAGREDPSARTPVEEASGTELSRQIDDALETLPEKQRQALVLFSIQKMPQKQVATILGISVEAVKWHVFTARKKLKDILKDYL